MAATSAPNHDGVMLLEAPFARVPHEELRRYLRVQQRHVERDLTYCSTSLDALSKSARLSSSSHLQPSPTTFPAPSIGTETPRVQNSSGTSGTVSRTSEEAGESSIIDNSLLAEVSFSSDARADESFMSAMAADTEGAASTIEGLDISSLAKKSGSELERSLDQMIGRIKGLKRKLGSVHESAGSTLTRLDARTGHLNELQQIQSTSSPAFDEWCRTRLDRMLVDWMLRKGFTQSATMLSKNRHIENYVDLNLFTEISRIEGSLIGTSAPDADSQDQASNNIRSCTATLAWCSENKAALRKIRSTLEFDLRLQEFIELTRDRSSQSLQEAINYSRRYLLPYLAPTAPSTSTKTDMATDATLKAKTEEKEEREEQEQQEWIRNQVARVMGLLACGPSGWAYTDLYDVSRWNALQQKFRAAALQIHSLPPQPLLHIALSAGLSSLKLPACYTDDPSRASDVPAHLGGRAFGDERSNLLSVAGVTSTSISAPPIFPPAAGYAQELSAPPSVVLSPPSSNQLTSALSSLMGGGEKNGDLNGAHSPLLNCKNDNCPVCDARGLGVLAKEVPWSHHINSTLVCAISGRIMNENDPPMALPNGRVYSLTALQEMASASQDGQTIICPRTMATFKLNDLRKVYIS